MSNRVTILDQRQSESVSYLSGTSTSTFKDRLYHIFWIGRTLTVFSQNFGAIYTYITTGPKVCP